MKHNYFERVLFAMRAAIQKCAVANAKSPTEISNVVLRLSPLALMQALIAGKFQYLKAEYDDLHFVSSPPRDNINCPFTVIGTVSPSDPTPLLDFDCSGNQAVYSPEFTVMAGIQKTVPLDSLDLVFALNSRWVDDQVTGFWNLPHEVIKSHTVTDVDITLASKAGNWSVSAYARNLEDRRRVEFTQASPIGMAMTAYGPPMMHGARAYYEF